MMEKARFLHCATTRIYPNVSLELVGVDEGILRILDPFRRVEITIRVGGPSRIFRVGTPVEFGRYLKVSLPEQTFFLSLVHD